ncbi:putative surface protein with fasciclin (FAS1) repeats [Pedobacter sp. AK013]|uniref:fasciclin domain-containing protein n=1 Tax=Pedobacter sp. AK013 TaxID=2723071 RepID=UPI00160D3676|nr:fasciclin domain-containing protein [Pedobacter sp. AK013]MBB6238271.1 putative surface protein with fasciclin (FAS1) repeats [Pedobacter sp. AK013]
MTRKYIIYVALLSICTVLYSCKDNLELHNELTNVDNSLDLAQKLDAQANVSIFNGYVKTTGYDKVLAGAQNYTVWAPTNQALANLDAAIVSDPAKLKDFVANHIALSTYPLNKIGDTTRLKLLNNKFGVFTSTKFEEGSVTDAGQFVKNGVLYTVDQAVPTKQNIWDYMLSSTDGALQKNYINNLSITVIDTANATIIGYNNLGNPIFAPNPPMVSRNTYWVNVADLRDESQQYTYFILQDAAFTAESSKLSTYYPSINPNLNASFFLVKDLTVKGVYPVEKLPDTLISLKGVKVPINKANIIRSYRASNGMVHVVNALPFRLKDKVPEFKIEGEKPQSFSAARTILYRTKLDNLGKTFNDIEVYDHKYAEFGVFYIKANLPVVKYKVYARAISGLPGDPQVAAFTQRYFFFNPTTASYTLFYTHLVNPLTYNEVYLGEYTPTDFGNFLVRLTAANSTSVNVSTLILDYLRFEPVLP